jgi:hypothetical protein
MYPNPEFFKSRLWEREQEVIHDHVAVPRGMGPQIQKELADLGIGPRGPRERGLLSTFVLWLIALPTGRMRPALRTSGVRASLHPKPPGDRISPSTGTRSPP